MKKAVALLMVVLMCMTLLTGCVKDLTSKLPDKPQDGDTTKKGETTQTESKVPDVAGLVYDTGEFQALVPNGWKGFPISDAFSDVADAVDTSCFNIIKDGTSDLDLFSKPYVRLDYYGPDTWMMKPSSDWYENVEDVEPMQLGEHSWSGFTGEDGYGKVAVLWSENGDYQYQATIWLEIESKTITLEDADLQAILASVKPSDGSNTTGDNTTGPSADGQTVATDNLDWWDREWYGWWCIQNGTGIYESASDVAWDAYAEIEAYSDYTGFLKLWDTGTSRDEPLAYGYEITFEPGSGELACMISDRVVFFPMGKWNNGSAATTMESINSAWAVDPTESTVSHFQDMIEILGHYEDPSNAGDSFDYYIYLRPWGTLWEDVRSGDTSGCIYSDMMPLYYDNWYISLLNLGHEHPVSSFDEGIAIINDYLAGNTGTGSLDPADKEGADGKVDMQTLKSALAWCKDNASYNTTYNEIATQFGVHGKQEKSLFENNTIYRWWATDDAYVKITFSLQADGTELWNVTQYDGI